MAKPNPNRIELLEFINQATSELNIHSEKIQDLSSGVQYLHLLHQTHPQIVKMSKVNFKASHQYQCIANVRLLSAYLAQIKAPFNFDVQKISKRNYQENLNLLKNIYKFHFTSLSEKNKPNNPNSRDSSPYLDSKIEFKKQTEKIKPIPKVNIRPPQKPVVKPPPKKHPVEKGVFDDYIKDSQKYADQIRSIMIVVKGEEPQPTQKEIAAQQKLTKIMKILGINPPQSSKKNNHQNQNRVSTHSSMRCEPSKSSSNKTLNLESNSVKNQESKPTSELKNQLQKIQQKIQNPEREKKSKKTFDCDEVRQNALKKYGLHPSQKSVPRQTRLSSRNLLNLEEDDPRYNEMLLSPDIELKEQKKQNASVRKSALIRRPVEGVSLERNQRQSLKKVRWEGQSSDKKKVSSEKKKLSSVKENDESVRVSSAVKSSERVLRSQRKENENASQTLEMIMD